MLPQILTKDQFGAFVELTSGVEGLVHISELAEHRIRAVNEAVREGVRRVKALAPRMLVSSAHFYAKDLETVKKIYDEGGLEFLDRVILGLLFFGIGDNFAKGHQVDYVLSRWTKEEETILLPQIAIAVDIIKNFALVGIDRTMNEFNS